MFPEVPDKKLVSTKRCENGATREAPSLNRLSPRVKKNDIDTKTVLDKRKFHDIDPQVAERAWLPEAKSKGASPRAAKKRRLGFHFPKGPHFPTAPRSEVTLPKNASKKVVKSKYGVKDASARKAMDNEEA